MSNSNVLTDVIDIKLMKPEEVKFSISENGFLEMIYSGQKFERIITARLLPYTCLYTNISVMDKDKNEIGIIKDVDELEPESARLLKCELDRRYFCHIITAVTSAKNKMGYLYVEAETSKGFKSFAVNDVTRNIRLIDISGRVFINDVDGNRYEVENYHKLDKKSQKLIIPHLF